VQESFDARSQRILSFQTAFLEISLKNDISTQMWLEFLKCSFWLVRFHSFKRDGGFWEPSPQWIPHDKCTAANLVYKHTKN